MKQIDIDNHIKQIEELRRLYNKHSFNAIKLYHVWIKTVRFDGLFYYVEHHAGMPDPNYKAWSDEESVCDSIMAQINNLNCQFAVRLAD